MMRKKIGFIKLIRLWGIVFLTALAGVIVGIDLVTTYHDQNIRVDNMRKDYVEKQKQKAKREVERVVNMMNYERTQNEALIGTELYVNVEQLQAVWMERINNIRFDKNLVGYLFVDDWNGKSLAHGAQPDLINTEMWEYEDSRGNKTTQLLVAASKKEDGGFASFWWRKPDTGEERPKIVYAKGIPEWELFVGSGVYIDDIERDITILKAALNAQTKAKILIFIIIVAIAFALFFILFNLLSNRLRKDLNLFISFFDQAAFSDKKIDRESVQFVELDQLAEYANKMLQDKIIAQQDLMDERELLFVTIRSIGDGVITTDKSGKVMHMNPVAEKLTGWSLEEATGKSLIEVFNIVHAVSRDIFDNSINRVLTNGKIIGVSNDLLLIAKDGKESQIADNLAPIRNSDDDIVGAVLVFRDITDLKRAEEALRESEEQYRGLAEAGASIGEAIVVVQDTDTIKAAHVFANPVWVRMTGYSVKELEETSYYDLIHPRYRDEVVDRAQRRLQGENIPGQYEISIVSKDGQEVPVEVSASSSIPFKGKPSNVGYIRDITERKQAEEELTRLRLYLKNMFDSMPSVLVGVDTKGNVTQWNGETERLTGLSADDARGQPLMDVLPQLTLQMEKIKTSISRKEPHLEQKVSRQENGETHYSDIMIYPLISNGVEGAVIRMDDVTDRVRIEQMMIQTEKMMSVGGLAAGMAHEINNPLGAIMQGVQNAIRRLSPDLEANQKAAEECGTDLETVRSYLEKRGILRYFDGMKEAGTRAARIVSNMLDFSRRTESKLAPTEINELMDNVLELADSDYDLFKKYDFRHVEIVRDYGTDLSQVPCTTTEIEQVYLNLIRNAAEAMAGDKEKEEGPRITIRTRREKDHALIEVEDNGPGMDEETRKRVFEPFFTTKPVGVGTGLGLSVSYFIITNNHNGSVSVESEPGKGTKFIIRLPLERNGS